MAINTSITTLPTPPSSADSATFSTRADNFLAALPTFQTQLNSYAGEANSTQTAINASQTASAQSVINAAAQVALAATQAANSASSATDSAASALKSANSAAASDASRAASIVAQLAAEAALDAFDDKYLGAKAADPTTDNDGNPLQQGAFYVNTLTGFVRVYVGTTWVQGISAIAGVSSINAQQGSLNLKTLQGQSLLGTGDITFKTIDGQSPLGTGDIVLPRPEVSNGKAYFFSSF